MRKHMMVVISALLCLSWATSALAQTPSDFDETTRNIICFGLHERMEDRPSRSIVRIFVAPEPGPLASKGMRLFVGLVEAEDEAGKKQIFYRGPLAHDWQRPRATEAREGGPNGRRSLRYHVDRLYRGPGGKPQTDTAEIDLETTPPVVRYTQRDQGRPVREVLVALEQQPLTPSTRLLLRSYAREYATDTLTLRSLGVRSEGTHADAPEAREASTKNQRYYVVSSRDGRFCAIHAMPPRRSWWQERLLHVVSPKSVDGSFVVELMEGYAPPNNNDPLAVRDRRLRINVSLKGLRTEVVDDGLLYDVEHDVFYIP